MFSSPSQRLLCCLLAYLTGSCWANDRESCGYLACLTLEYSPQCCRQVLFYFLNILCVFSGASLCSAHVVSPNSAELCSPRYDGCSVPFCALLLRVTGHVRSRHPSYFTLLGTFLHRRFCFAVELLGTLEVYGEKCGSLHYRLLHAASYIRKCFACSVHLQVI